jgi:6-phosphogluconolactonase
MSSASAQKQIYPVFREFESADTMFGALAEKIAASLSATVARAGSAGFVVSGGTTPGDLYDVLAKKSAPWDRVTLTMSDERWVEPTSDRSNERLVRLRLLVGKAAAARLVPFKTAAPHARDAEKAVHDSVTAMPRPFDVMLLGMGTDGHTASLIPGSEGLARALDTADPMYVRAVNPPKLTEMGERMTLTLRAILDSRRIVILIKGEAKRAAYKDVLGGDDVLAAPVRAVLRQVATPVEVFWSP